MFKKRRSDNVVINTDDFDEYRLRRDRVKETMKASQDAKEAKIGVAHIKTELAEIKDLLKNLLNEKK